MTYVSLDELLERADLVSLHVPLLEARTISSVPSSWPV